MRLLWQRVKPLKHKDIKKFHVFSDIECSESNMHERKDMRLRQ